MNTNPSGLQRFIHAQETLYPYVLEELKRGRKTGHWMWFIFPQLKGLGHSSTADHYGIRDLEEAAEYLQHPVIGRRLVQVSNVLLSLSGRTATQIFGSPDDLKLRSCMTLFSRVPGADPVFQQVLDRFYNGLPDKRTLIMSGISE
ncbi:MAG: DUF1810 domain-containing protein [Bacteroidetes bacterium]|nr:DUF1810 domain-containing protein [Bacteroidota bacterium]